MYVISFNPPADPVGPFADRDKALEWLAVYQDAKHTQRQDPAYPHREGRISFMYGPAVHSPAQLAYFQR